MIYLYLFGTCFHFIYVFMIIAKYQKFSIFALSILHEQTTAKASNKLVG